ncbi:MAG: hypothetical protein MI755_08780 [Sphingomonadales bacterium]|nr:hypothetical protein [Sphingomonadales bacterium]
MMERAVTSGALALSPLRPSPAQRRYLELGLRQPGGKLPLFDRNGQRINPKTIQSCLDKGWCERWYDNPVEPGWQVCRLTDRGREAVDD